MEEKKRFLPVAEEEEEEEDKADKCGCLAKLGRL